MRLFAAIAFIIAIVLFAVAALGSADPHIVPWGLVSTAAGLLCLALDGFSWPTVGPPPR